MIDAPRTPWQRLVAPFRMELSIHGSIADNRYGGTKSAVSCACGDSGGTFAVIASMCMRACASAYACALNPDCPSGYFHYPNIEKRLLHNSLSYWNNIGLADCASLLALVLPWLIRRNEPPSTPQQLCRSTTLPKWNGGGTDVEAKKRGSLRVWKRRNGLRNPWPRACACGRRRACTYLHNHSDASNKSYDLNNSIYIHSLKSAYQAEGLSFDRSGTVPLMEALA